MLVLTRKVGESITIGDDVKIIVMQIKGKQVRLGIKADPSIIVHREEVYQKIQQENKAASQAQPDKLSEIANIFKKQINDLKPPLKRHIVRPNQKDKK